MPNDQDAPSIDDCLPLDIPAQRQQLQRHQQQALLLASATRRHRKQRESAGARVRSVVGSTGTGFVYGAMLGGVLATASGLRAAGRHAPLSLQLRSVALYVRTEAPRSAGHVALVACAFRLASLGLAEARGVFGRGSRGEDNNSSSGVGNDISEKEDLWGVLLTAPIAGAALHMRHGPRAALHGALSFGSVAAVMLTVHAAERAVERRWPEVPGCQDAHDLAFEALGDPSQQIRVQRRRTNGSHHSSVVEAREVLEEIAFAEELDE